jgi:hypothetical protein
MKKIEKEMMSRLLRILEDAQEMYMVEQFGDEWLAFRDKMW